jgi:inosose dehydratase
VDHPTPTERLGDEATGRSHRSLPRVATAPVNWNNDDIPGGRVTAPFPAILDEMVAAGYDATESAGAFPTDPTVLAAALSARGLVLCGSYLWLDLIGDVLSPEDRGALETRLDLLTAVGCADLVVSTAMTPERVALAGRVPDGHGLDPEGWWRLASNLDEVGRAAAARGVRVHYHNHVGTFVETPPELERLIEVLPRDTVDLCFDAGHYAYAGGEPARFVERHLDSVGYVHLKDVDPEVLARARASGATFYDALVSWVFCELGTGAAQVDRVVAALLRGGFAGWLVVEQDTTPSSPTETARRNRRYLRDRFDL